MRTAAARRVVDAVKAMFAACERHDEDGARAYFLHPDDRLRQQLHISGGIHVEFVHARATVRDHTARLDADCLVTLRSPARTETVPIVLHAFLEEQDGRWLIRPKKKTGRKTCP